MIGGGGGGGSHLAWPAHSLSGMAGGRGGRGRLEEHLFNRATLAPRSGHLCYRKMPPGLWSGTQLSPPGCRRLLRRPAGRPGGASRGKKQPS